MSTWQNIPISNVDIDGDELNILVNSDEMGNNYVCVNIEELKQLLASPQIDKKDTK